ncbi:MAG TPA: hypothetical protein PLO61_06200 [Fimbriimonadaceae bacterium]|nr:hypothetical protein [Fimbriimonadaceae bacterium]HRJ33158.1 hypothetical protein [Fimbriimonadaceae bacterium]
MSVIRLDSGWSVRAASWKPGVELPAEVPGTIFRDLHRHGLIPDPMRGVAELGLEWVNEETWIYTWRGRVPSSGPEQTWLRFGGLDTFATVRWGGQQIGQSENAFLPVEFEITPSLTGESFELEIEFKSATQIGRARRSEYLAREGLPDSMACFDERAFVRRPQVSFGWDFSPRMVGCAVLEAPILLFGENRWLGYSPEIIWKPNGSVEVWAHAESLGDRTLEWRRRGPGEIWTRATEPLVWARGDYVLWPHQLTEVEFRWQGENEIVGCGPVPLRTIELDQSPDDWGESFRFVLNGERIVARGVNVVPHLPTTRPDGPYSGLPALPALFNMIRIWGGGCYLSSGEMSQFDQRGILVWHDFASACSYMPDDPESISAIAAEARHHVRRLRAHPALALWCGNNENLMLHQGRWGGEKNVAERFYGETIFEQVLPRIVEEFLPEIPYISSSPVGSSLDPRVTLGPGGEPKGTCNEATSGDCHYWDVWHGRGDWRHYSDCRARFVSEFGFPSWSAPQPEPGWIEVANRTGKPHEEFLKLLHLHQPPSDTLEELRYRSQLNQRDAMRHALIEMLGFPGCDGVLAWQWNDVAPGLSWAWTEWDGTPKIVAQWMARQTPALGMLRRDGGFLEIWVWPWSREVEWTLEFWSPEAESWQVRAQEQCGLQPRLTKVRQTPIDESDPGVAQLRIDGHILDAAAWGDRRAGAWPVLDVCEPQGWRWQPIGPAKQEMDPSEPKLFGT